MDERKLLDVVSELGYQLAMCGAETFRIEESISLILRSYGIRGEVFAIPNCMHVSVETKDGPVTKLRRMGDHGTDLDAVERFTGLSRRICAQKPDPETAAQWLQDTIRRRIFYSKWMILLGHFMGSFGFALLVGGTVADGLCAGVCGLLVWLISKFMDGLGANHFFKTLASSFALALLAYGFTKLGVANNPDCVSIGTLMLLVPGLLFTNAMRDIIYGDTNSGINRIILVLLTAVAIALGTAAAWNVAAFLWGAPEGAGVVDYNLLEELLPCLIGCFGFAVIFNIHGPGGLLCIVGGALAWSVYILVLAQTGSELHGYFWGAFVASFYSEIMARIRKYPAISYLVVSIFPLIPGAGVYYTMNYAVQGQMDKFASQGMHTAAIAGIMAVGILLVSTVFRLCSNWKRKH